MDVSLTILTANFLTRRKKHLFLDGFNIEFQRLLIRHAYTLLTRGQWRIKRKLSNLKPRKAIFFYSQFFVTPHPHPIRNHTQLKLKTA